MTRVSVAVEDLPELAPRDEITFCLMPEERSSKECLGRSEASTLKRKRGKQKEVSGSSLSSFTAGTLPCFTFSTEDGIPQVTAADVDKLIEVA